MPLRRFPRLVPTLPALPSPSGESIPETTDIQQTLNSVNVAMQGSAVVEAYATRHGIESQAILTIDSDEMADKIVSYLAPRIEGKTVVEIGGGVGLLALHMGDIAKRVYCIEANPMWSWIFTSYLLVAKPKNVSFLFGAADEFAGVIHADVALFCTHSGVGAMASTAAKFAPVVIDVYGEIIRSAPEKFDFVARELRGKS